MMTTTDLVQAGIVLCSATAAWLVNQRSARLRGWAAVVGLCGQPLWFWAAWQAQQWGILALSGWYTLAWARGLWNWRCAVAGEVRA